MGVKEYIAKREEGEKVNHTIVHYVRQAYTELERKLIGEDGLVDVKKLKDKNTAKEAGKAAYAVLKEYALAHYNAATADEGRKEDLVFGLFGIDSNAFDKYIESQEGNVSFEDLLLKYLPKRTAFGYFQNQNMAGKPMRLLAEEDAQEVVKHTGTEGRVDPNKLGVEEMAELLGEFINEKVITGTFLREKDYRIKEEEKPIENPQEAEVRDAA